MPLRIILVVTGIFTTVLLSYFGVSSGLTGHVCNRTEDRNFTRLVKHYRTCRTVVPCGLLDWDRCTSYYDCSTYSLAYDTLPVTVEYCCEGWTAGVNATNTSSCDIPVCTTGCGNNGECIAPDTCKCQPHYHGLTCNETYDPCQITTELSVGFERSRKNTNFTADPKCDSTLLRTWYKIGHSPIFHMPTTCPGSPACGTTGPVWVNITNTSIPAGAMVTLEACVGSPDSCCESLLPVQIKNCTDFMVYYLSPTVACPQAYCFEVPPCLDCNRPVCPYGYRYDSKTAYCKDIDECALENDGCRDTCVNTHGSYYCECRDPGFTLSANRHTCQDINECAVNNGGCGDVCINTYGSYHCECKDAGFTLSDDGHSCREIQWWDDARLYPFGQNAGDNNTLDDLKRLSWSGRYSDSVCVRVKLLRAGFPFFNGRHYNVHICYNGVLQFKLEWQIRTPWRFGTRNWMDRHPQIAPFWCRSDARLFSQFNVNRDKTLVYYQVYEMNDGKAGTEAIIARATADVKHYTQIYKQELAEFAPTWVMVVTWTNLPPYVSDCSHWRWYYYIYRYGYYYNPCSTTRMQNLPVNNFQAVLMTDGQFSFVKFIYPDINWVYEDYAKDIFEKFVSSSIRYGMPVAGYSAGDASASRQNTYYNMPASGKSVMADLDTDVGNTGEAGTWLIRLEENSGEGTAILQCYRWAKKEFRRYSRKLSRANLGPCPCNSRQAWWDRRFRFEWWNTQDYDGNRICYRSTFQRRNLRRRCCYSAWWFSNDWGSLLVGSPNGGHVVDNINTASEEYGYQKCCVESTFMCQLFYVLLPSNDCEGYRPPRRRTFWGDPHLVTLDGLNYTFNGLGEFTLLDVGSGKMQVQARTRKVSDTSKATIFTSVAIQLVNHSLIQVNLKNGTEEELEVFINCSMIDIGNFTNDTSTHSSLPDTVLLSRPENNSFQVTYENGITVSTKALKGALSINFDVPETFENLTKGLMGVFNNDKSDDLTPSNGAPIPETSSEADIYHQFGMTWMVTNETTIFCYQAGESYEIYNFPDFTPMFTDNITFANATLQAAAEALCGSDMSCLYDIAQTGDLGFGETTLSEKIASDKAASELDNFPPKITGPRSHKVQRGVFTTITTNVSDANGDTITCQLETNGSTSANLSQVSGDEFNVGILISSISEEINLKLIAKDTNDARSTYQPVIEYCPCENGGTCESLSASELEEASSYFIIMECTCPDSYTGTYCESDIDACAENTEPCYPGVRCQNDPPSRNISGYTCGPCPEGYTGDGKTCDDINECVNGSECDHICINIPGSYACSCNTGYQLATGGRCDDVNECVPASDCSQTCINTQGSYTCGCDAAFSLQADGKTCAPTTVCTTNIGCDLVNGWCYVDSPGTNQCDCKKGFTLTGGTQCNDEDECSTGANRCNQQCVNTVGSYNCSCNGGYIMSTNGYTCKDIDECNQLASVCNSTQLCINSPGGYNCTCPTGTVDIGGQCKQFADDVMPAAAETRTPSTAERENAVRMSAQMEISDYTVAVDTAVTTTIASAATSYCAGGNCTLITATTRRRRSTPTLTFSYNFVLRVPGYPAPSSDDPTSIDLAYYVLTETGDIMPAADLVAVMQDAQTDLQIALGNVSITQLGFLVVPVTGSNATNATTPAVNATTPAVNATTPVILIAYNAESTYWIWGVVIGGSVLLIIIIVVIATAVCVRMHNASKYMTVGTSVLPPSPTLSSTTVSGTQKGRRLLHCNTMFENDVNGEESPPNPLVCDVTAPAVHKVKGPSQSDTMFENDVNGEYSPPNPLVCDVTAPAVQKVRGLSHPNTMFENDVNVEESPPSPMVCDATVPVVQTVRGLSLSDTLLIESGVDSMDDVENNKVLSSDNNGGDDDERESDGKALQRENRVDCDERKHTSRDTDPSGHDDDDYHDDDYDGMYFDDVTDYGDGRELDYDDCRDNERWCSSPRVSYEFTPPVPSKVQIRKTNTGEHRSCWETESATE